MEEEGRWVTLKSGKKVFIKEGQSLVDAIVRQQNKKREEIIAYHSTPNDFNEFDENYIREQDMDFPFNGFFFTEKEEGASPYENSKYVMKVEINPSKIAKANDLADVLRELNQKYDLDDYSQIPQRSRSWEDEVRYMLKDKGFDAMQTRGVNLKEAEKVLSKQNTYNYETPLGYERKLVKEDGYYTYYEANYPINTYKTLEEWKKDNPSEWVVFDKKKIKILEKKEK